MTSIQCVFDQNNRIGISGNMDFYVPLALGRMPDGIENVGKFGQANAIIDGVNEPCTIWDMNNEYTYSDTANITGISSASALDTQTVRVSGLDGDGNSLQQWVTLNGQNTVLFNEPFWRVWRIENQQPGTELFDGDVYVYIDGASIVAGVPQVDQDVRAKVRKEVNQTLMCVYTIPLGKVGMIVQGDTSLIFSGGNRSTNDFAIVEYRVRPYQSQFATKKTVALQSSAAPFVIDVIPGAIPALADIEVFVREVSSDMGVAANFELLLFDEKYASAAKLESIGQPSST